MNKTIRNTDELVGGANDVMRMNPMLMKESEAYTYSYHVVATDIVKDPKLVDWDAIARIKLKTPEITGNYSATRGVFVEDEDYKVVIDHYGARPNVHRIPFAYLTRLVLLYTRKKLSEEGSEKPEQPIQTIKLDGVNLIREIAELLEDQSDDAKEVIVKIKTIVDEYKEENKHDSE